MKGRGLVEAEEKRSYGAVFLFSVGLLLACAVWALWQDSFSRHLWKQYKADFYRVAISKYEGGIADDHTALGQNEEYQQLLKKADTVRKDLATGEAGQEIATIQAAMEGLEVERLESDLALRIIKGEVEEAWYHLEHATHAGETGKEEHDHLEHKFHERDEGQERFDQAEAAIAEAEATIAELRSAELDLEAELRTYHKDIEANEQRLDLVSFELFGGRVASVPTIEQVVLWGFDRNNFEQWVDRVERCQNCHMAIDRAGFEDGENPLKTHPNRQYYLGNHPVADYGCTPCHGGQGAAINSVELAHGLIPFWEDPLLDLESDIQAKCITCHESALGFEGAEVAARGEWLFQEMGCHGCHLASGYEDMAKAGPSLARIAAKVSPEWLVEWIQHPQAFRPRTRMPNFMLRREEAEGIAAYLIDASFDNSVAWLGGADQPEGADAADTELVGKGRELIDSLGCLGCHGLEPDQYASQVADGKDVAPNLARIAEKTSAQWIYNWIRDPRGYSEHARMPSLRLTDDEAAAIVSYLLNLKTEQPLGRDPELRRTLASAQSVALGEKLVRRYGCFGCHVIPGMESESRIGAELSSFGDKHLEELFFGDRLDIPFTLTDWTVNKILTPRTYQTERIEQLMPRFGLSENDAHALTVFLTSRTDRVIHSDYLPGSKGDESTLRRGRQVVARYNCQGCHSFDGREGAIRQYYEDNLEDAPPILVGEGSKLQGHWFFNFLMKPVRLRPWLDVRMPTFGLSTEEASAVVAYFQALEGYSLGDVSLESAEAAGPAAVRVHAGVPEGVFDCYSCHVESSRGPEDGEYAVSDKGLPLQQMQQWAADNLGLEGVAAPDEGTRENSKREYLGVSAN